MLCITSIPTMTRVSILRVGLIVVVASSAFSFQGDFATNEARAETKLAPPTDPPEMKNDILRVDVIRRDSHLSPLADGQSLSNAERLRQAIQRSHNRLRRFQHYTSQNASYYTNVSAADGEFLMKMEIGSPVPLTLHFILDTGSDLIWTQCQPCSKYSCVPQNDPMFNPFQSSSYSYAPCSDHFCSALSPHWCRANLCSYQYMYGDDSSTTGVLAYETFSLATTVRSPQRVSVPHIAFGCGATQEGDFSDSAGIFGLGRGPLSFVSQIGSSVNHVFSYCLGSYDNASQVSPLFLGKAATLGAGFRVTPLVPNTRFPSFYYLGLQGISVAGKAAPIPKATFQILANGSGGLVIDSGTTITLLEDPGYKPFLDTVRSTIPTRPVNTSATTDYDLCYNATPALRFPIITFHFAGGAKYVLPEENSFQVVTDGIVCLIFASAGPAGSLSFFGNVQQQNFHIVYDLGHKKLYFAPTNCQSI